MSLILASRSERRLALLKSIGLYDICVIPSHLDETPHKKELPKKLSERLAYEKSFKVFQERTGDALLKNVLGADTVVGCGRRIISAPETDKEAYQCLDLLSGRSHRVYTSLCLISPAGKIWQRSVETRVLFKGLSEEEKEAYVKSQEGFGKAGGYAIQGFAGSFVKRINGSYSCILGMPLFEVRNLLQNIGFSLLPSTK